MPKQVLKEAKTIQHGKEGESYHCRQCHFNGTELRGCLEKVNTAQALYLSPQANLH